MSSSESSSRSRSRGARTPQLDRTLLEIESAFHDWESLNSVKSKVVEEERLKKTMSEQSEEEFRNKTSKLLHQLRRQLAEL